MTMPIIIGQGVVDESLIFSNAKVGNDVIESYRNYYREAKKSFCVWKNREIPEWFSTEEVFI